MLPVDLAVLTVVSWEILAAAVSQLSGLKVPWWALGPGLGGALWASGTTMLVWMGKSNYANSSPTSIELDDDGLVALLPPLLGSRAGGERRVSVPWAKVEAVNLPGFFRPGYIRFRRASAPTTTLGGTPQGDTLLIAAAPAHQVQKAWQAWRANQPPVASAPGPSG